jgi:Na+/pantothenate symporter
MIVYALDEHPSEALAIAMTVAGVATVIGWRAAGLDVSVVYEVMPGMLAGLLTFAAGKMAGMAPPPRMKP